jgi:hypothetical protein
MASPTPPKGSPGACDEILQVGSQNGPLAVAAPLVHMLS